MRLNRKVAIITGGGRGIGEVTARLFAREGANVVIADIDAEEGKKIVKTINGEGHKAIFVEADVTNVNDVKKVIKSAVETYGQLDILFNNAGICGTKTLVDITEEEFDREIAVDLKGPFLFTKYAIPEMVKNGGGSIINSSSTLGLYGVEGFAAYQIAKGGILMLTKNTAITYGSENIRCNAICPGPIETQMSKGVFEAIARAKGMAAEEIAKFFVAPLGKDIVCGQPENVASTVLFLASDESCFITGIAIPIDGGFTAK